ncbi:hypothetical protein A2926_01775 [Candidatus Giovannonibacteria bacterium RIFCSPLOWO2_01_FULL_44_40]|uniref:DUF7768 domain-containing protein n=1 Tax=Candidatus Giovannonibacteria bacterium RIFCSPHIGHO2_01_FULL_45_23 TaxID=1798325 RepID=A0A1F5VJT6_9BACT|nr:MAG: hypothetical protein A2834_01420 [Candidatus Giovannonibacteria bacterium RIFCSPHIGHO2_01_FULL_45_23]OGF76807.1 MAG: hypothetical protein A3C77_00190 [Candidatus Giovannonibacteria bacterium RIFCSPHIGHO2_02_FULL_45_13]OGF79731.1 MAG: hypothetical protein A2926_01775 [Candidatus Giovannonibacteria bacterium RIFCSPLOWO2_01_FULL_44_40]
MTKVFIASRIGAKTKKQFEKNLNRMKAFARFALLQGYEPEATGIYYCQFMNDFDQKEREWGIERGQERLKECKEIWVLEDGMAFSEGVTRDRKIARENDLLERVWNVDTVENYLKGNDPYGYELWLKSK